MYNRLRQFWRGLTATVEPQERGRAMTYLPEKAAALFARLPIDAQRHSLNVLHELENGYPDCTDLLAAGLLHDIGKLAADEAGVRINLWMRGPLVLAERVAPALLSRLAQADRGAGWRYALYVHRAHPAIGAAWAAEAGCSDRTCWLIRHHQDKSPPGTAEQQELLRALQWADNRN